MKEITCIVIDDEPLARELLTTYIGRTQGWQLLATCQQATVAYEALLHHHPDVIFLDIRMPVISGIDFLRSLKHPPAVIFTTAYPEYAVNAFDLRAVDYLLKPITEERFREATDKMERLIAGNNGLLPAVETDYIFIKQDSKLVKVLLGDILYVEALKDFSRIHLKTGSMLVGHHLKLMEDMLPGRQFMRVHRSYMVALSAITAIQGNTLEVGPVVIPLGGSYKTALFRRLNLHDV
ncbi:LytR/AlgR family response regulator transcription factor [Chitinophaga solisilvae]|uniref:Response regulator transcription factor n=1 Tax=Chitinophaga solisilvae TaxID=1233460 RepID=A0A3S1CYQ8_9BACT|nr:response regulator [Chitinophaga solisilvae]NSL86382.1 response regulator transcription factor [Chitinophaga solisilvae]